MSTVVPNNETQTKVPASGSIAPKTILKSAYSSVIAALQGDNKIILITGSSNKGKTALLHTINKDIAADNRIITLSGKDLPSLDKSKNNSSTELNNMKDFIFESTDLEDKLVVILDDAHCLPINFLSGLIEGIKNSEQKTNNLQLILSGPLNFKDQLLAIEQIDTEDLLHCTIDSLSNEEIQSYIKSKTYKISSNIKQLKFDISALSEIADFIQSDQQLLDVILEWCSAIIKKDQLTSMSSQTAKQAASFAQQFSKDKNLHLSNSYPPSHEVYKYINDIQSSKEPPKKTNESVKGLPKNSVKKIHTSKIASQKTKIPTISANAGPTAMPKQQEKQSGNTINEDEVISANWIPQPKLDQGHKKSFPVAAGLTIFLLIGFIAFIAFQIGSDSKNGDLPKQIASTEEPSEATVSNQKVIDNQPNVENALSDTVKQNTTETVPVEALAIAKEMGNTEKSIPASQKPMVLADINLDKDSKPTELNEKNAATIALEEKIKASDGPKQTNPSEEKVQATEQSLKPELSSLLIQAKFQLENKQLSTPAGDNALETYQKILAKFPNNQDAIEGIKNVHDKYLGWANYYLKQNDLDRAKNFYNKALGINPSNAYAIKNLQVIAQQEAVAKTTLNNQAAAVNLGSQQNNQPKEVESLLISANEKMQQIYSDIRANNRNYKTYQEVQTTYQEILRSAPQNSQALKGLIEIKTYYTDWAELQVQSKNYNIALFLYGQALSIEPENSQINQRIEQIRALKKAL